MSLKKSLPFGFYEFFCGGGMARLGLGQGWKCLFANDFDAKKGAAYQANFVGNEFVCEDVKKLKANLLPGNPTLAWASFPCQDLSLAGMGAGLQGERSGTFFPFLDLILKLKKEGRNPPLIALENVSGLVTSHGGQDLTNLVNLLTEAGYRVGALQIDGAYFVAQSRPRLFIIAVARGVAVPRGITSRVPTPAWHTTKLQNVVQLLSEKARRSWIWWKLPMPAQEAPHLSTIIEEFPQGVEWHTAAETKKILDMMSPANFEKVRTAKLLGERQVGTIYKRTRQGIQRAEVRFDGVSGCLRTPSGGSSRQVIMVVEGKKVRTRLISSRETARLMGLPEKYKLPTRYNDAYHLTGDGVVVPVVSWLEQHLIHPLALSAQKIILEREGAKEWQLVQ